jgi:hypothetical protein
MSSQKRLSTALAAIALALVSVSSGSHLGELAAGRDGAGRRLLDSGFMAVGAQPVALETPQTARRSGSVNRPRPPGGAMPLVALAAVWTLLHLWCLLRLELRALRACPIFGWTLAPRAPPLPRLL